MFNQAFLGIAAALGLSLALSLPNIDLSKYEIKYGAKDPINLSLSAMEARADYLESKKVPYKQQYIGDEVTGMDCSYSVRDVYESGGLKLPRLTSNKMWSMWPGVNIEDKDLMWRRAQFPNPIFWSYPVKKPKAPRPFGHTAITRTNTGKDLGFSEASSSKGYYKRTHMIKGDYRDLYWVGLKVIDIGEILEKLKKEKKG